MLLFCQQICKTQQWPQDWKRSVFIPIPKKGNAKECSNYHTIALISHASKVILKILQGRLQQYVNCELPDVQASFRKGRGTRDQIANIGWIRGKAREFQRSIYFCFIDYAKAFDCVDHNILWKILKEMGIPDHLTCLLRNLYAGQEATLRTGHGTTDCFQIGKGVHHFELWLEKTLENPLDCKEIQPVHSEGDQPWEFFGRNDAKAETSVLWPPHAKSRLIGKDSDAGRDWGQEEKGMPEHEMAGWHH